MTLPSLSGTSTITLPLNINNLGDVPAYEVLPGHQPAHPGRHVQHTGPGGAEQAAGEPDVFGDLGAAQQGHLTSVARVTEAGGRRQPARGFWGSFVQQIGPFTDPGAPAGTSTLTATAVTQPLDPAVTSTAGDPYAPGFTDTAPAQRRWSSARASPGA